MHTLTRIVLALLMSIAPAALLADTKAPYSKPFHKQGRGWYPSIYWSTGRNLGSFYFPNTNGRKFQALSESQWNPEENALIYVYRPDSQWAMEELEAPSYYINDELIFNLRSGSYTVIELPAGSYDFTARKSLLPLLGFEAFDDKLMIAFDLNLLADVGLELDPGSKYYFRHSEVSLPKRLHPDIAPDDPMATADVQLVDEELALEEMQHTRYLEHSFWHSNDSERAEALLKGEMQDYGWFSVIWPWSNNFLFGFPFFELPSEMFKKLRGDRPQLTLEQQLYQLKDDPEAYLEAIEDRRQPRRNWLAPWRPPVNILSLNDELLLEKLEKRALAGKIEPPPSDDEEEVEEVSSESGFWEWPFRTVNQPEEPQYRLSQYMTEDRKAQRERLLQTLD